MTPGVFNGSFRSRSQGLTIRREMSREGWILRFSGPEAKKGGLIDDVFDLVERWLQMG
jgi:ParB family transcriptional regulator, chromosome partitioning protein